MLNRRIERSVEGDAPSVSGVRYYRWRGASGGGEISYTVAGGGPPLLMLHGIYAGASSHEFRRNIAALSEDFTVYAPDLLGCGRSERPKLSYAPEDITGQIRDFAKEVIGQPTHLVASSLTAALVMPAAVREPRLFRKLVFVCPTGYRPMDRSSGRLGDVVYALFGVPVLGDGLYHALVSRRGIRFYLKKTAYHDPSLVTDEVVEEYYRAGHGRGAKHLPAAFASGKLNFDVSGHWPKVANRTMLCWGLEAKEAAPVELLNRFVGNNPRSAYRIFKNSALLPHAERPEAFNRELKEFLQGKG